MTVTQHMPQPLSVPLLLSLTPPFLLLRHGVQGVNTPEGTVEEEAFIMNNNMEVIPSWRR